jgi:hypothetical protein
MRIMTKKFKAAKTSIVIGLLLVGFLVAVLPTTSAGLIFNLQSALNVTWGNETQEPIVPRGELRTLTLVITHTVTRGALGEGVLVTLTGALIKIDVSIIETPSWCTAIISQGTLSVTVQPDEISTVETQLSIQVANDAPAYGLGYIKIKATAATTGIIAGYEDDFTLSFIPDYIALISPSFPETNTKEIGPMDTAVFPIDIENLGNARTKVLLTVTNLPVGWNAIITDELILEEGAGSMNTAYLTIRPPKGFGYHNDEKTITVSMKPVKYDDPTKQGETTLATFLLQSRGFSTPGFETIIFFGAFAMAFLIVAYTRKRKK